MDKQAVYGFEADSDKMDAMLSVNYDALINTPSQVKLRYLKICGGTLRYGNVKLFNV